MLFDPITIGIAAFVLPKVWEALNAPKKKGQRFTAQELARFTHQEGAVRHFDADIASRIPGMLQARTAVPEAPSPQAPGAQVWNIVPLRPGGLPASAVFDLAKSERKTVLGSLSLVFLPSGKPVPMVLVTLDPEHAAQFAGPSGQLAIVAQPAPVVEAAPEPAPEPAPKHSTNGVGKKAPAPKSEEAAPK